MWKRIYSDTPEVNPDSVVWIPAHCTNASIGTRTLGNGDHMTHTDWSANRRADLMAKKAAIEFCASEDVRLALATAENDIGLLAEYLGRMTWAANNHEGDVTRDSAPTTRTRLHRPTPGAARPFPTHVQQHVHPRRPSRAVWRASSQPYGYRQMAVCFVPPFLHSLESRCPRALQRLRGRLVGQTCR